MATHSESDAFHESFSQCRALALNEAMDVLVNIFDHGTLLEHLESFLPGFEQSRVVALVFLLGSASYRRLIDVRNSPFQG